MKADEFFIGYAPPMPPRLARFVARTVFGLACGALTWAATLAAGHVSLDGGTFEFGHPQRFTGTLIEHPYPALRPEGASGTMRAGCWWRRASMARTQSSAVSTDARSR